MSLLESLVACGGGGDTSGGATLNPPLATPVRIEIVQDTVLLTADQQENQLVATVQWRSYGLARLTRMPAASLRPRAVAGPRTS